MPSPRRRRPGGNAAPPALLEGLAEGVAVRDFSGRLLVWNGAAVQITGWAMEEAARRFPADPGEGLADLGNGCLVDIRALPSPDEWRGWAFTDARPAVALRQAIAHLDAMVTTDALTGLASREEVETRLRVSVDLAASDGRTVAVMAIDLDRFKVVNDALGHAAGDQVLQQVAARIRGSVRPHDSVGRTAGDEFLVVLHAVDGIEAAEQLGNATLAAIRQAIVAGGHEVEVSASAGLALFPDHGRDAAALLRHADLALEQARLAGGGQLRVASPASQLATRERLLLSTALHRAQERGQLEVFWQPQLDLDTGAVSGVEALLRWRHPDLGLLAPGRFLDLSEEDGSVIELDRYVLAAATSQARAWLDDGVPFGTVAVNLSARTLDHHPADRLVAEALDASGLPPDRLEVEISEHVAGAEGVGARLSKIRDLGARVAIDDFGTGYSSLGHLKRLPLDTLKLDRSFVVDIAGEPSKADIAILRAIVTLAADLGLRCVAEGVETTAQRRLLRFLQCHIIQGHLYAPALPSAEVEPVLRRPFTVPVG